MDTINKRVWVAHIVAVANDNVIGAKGGIPWKSSVDMAFFRDMTIGHPIIMGRKTYDSLPGKLKGRHIFVVTKDDSWEPEVIKGEGDVICICNGIEKAITLAKQKALELGKDTVWIAGGAEIYRQTLPLVDMIMKTKVDVDVYGDTYYPEINNDEWYERHSQKSMDGDLMLHFECLGRVIPINT